MVVYLLALLMGAVAGLRTMTPPAVVSWAAYLGRLDVSDSYLGWLANPWAVGVLTVLALVELVTDQLPSTPSRTVPVQFGARLVSGAICGAAIAMGGMDSSGAPAGGLVAGVVGAIVGTLGGRAMRGWMAAKFGKDRPAAFIEDAVAIGAAIAIGAAL